MKPCLFCGCHFPRHNPDCILRDLRSPEPREYRRDALTREQQELIASVVVFQRTGHCPTTGDLAELLAWPRVKVERVASELVAEGMLKRTVGGGAWSAN